MAVGPAEFPVMHPVPGLRLGVAQAGIKYAGRDDLLLLALAPGSRTAGVFTRNAFCAAPVTLCRRHLAQMAPRYLLVNSGNANACTGERGMADALASCAAVAERGGVEPGQVLPFSTGVIGEPLPLDKLVAAVPAAFADLREEGWERAARAIMTTDTRPKGFSEQLEFQGHRITVTGIAKGAGMIRPNMATMLAYIATDVPVAQRLLEQWSRAAADLSFNRITIDGDTSTNDACVLMATGEAGIEEIADDSHPLHDALRDLIVRAHTELAQAIVRDGEGATKFVTVDVSGGADRDECLAVAYAVAHSPLVKTALFASDPNWGRIVAAIGYAGVENLDVSRVQVSLNDAVIVADGGRAPGYTEAQGQQAVSGEDIVIRIQLGRGDCREVLWTSDLSYEYVRINADYRS